MGKKFDMTDVQWENLEKEISEILSMVTGLRAIKLNLERKYYRENEIIEIKSNELQDYMYPKMFYKLYFSNFGGGWSEKEEQYWLPIHYRYEHFSGGTNGSDCITIWLDKNGNIINYMNELQKGLF